MSKAFTRESDLDEWPDLPPLPPPVAPGMKNYVTVKGLAALKQELTRLTDVERPPLAAQLSNPDVRHALQSMDRRIRYVQESLRTAVVGGDDGPSDKVRFGATVTVRESGAPDTRYRIVGV